MNPIFQSLKKYSITSFFYNFSLLVLAGILVTACNRIKRLDEQVFYEGPEVTLKVVRYYRNLFMSFNGEVYSVQCRSSETAGNQAKKEQDPGWQKVSTGAALGSKNAQEVVDTVKDDYLIMDDRTVVRTGHGLGVSFDACGTFSHWGGTTLPIELIDTIEKPDYCAPKGGADCRHYDFEGDRAPQISDIRTDPSGRISFIARSTAFKDGAVFRIESQDYGRSWGYTPVVLSSEDQD